jgi:hypothetical protein
VRAVGRRPVGRAVGRRGATGLDGAERPVVAALDRTAAVEPGRDDGDPDLVAERVVDDRAEDDVGLGVGRLLDQPGRLVDLEQAEVEPPEIESSTPWAPSMLASSSGEEIASSAPGPRGPRPATSRCP